MSQKTLESQLNQLEEIVEKLSNDRLTLEEALSLYTDGVEISKTCETMLSEARQVVEKGRMQLEESGDELE